mgnify:CR=1 FL=1
MTTSTMNTFDPEDALGEIFAEYRDHEQQIYSHHRTLKAVKDQYYLYHTGLRYKDWVKTQTP